jgi:hypothetical protein
MRWIWLLFAVGCAPKMNIEVLQPASKTLPEHIKKVATLDRGATGNRITRDAAEEAASAMTTGVSSSPRFEVTELTDEQAHNFNALERTLAFGVVDAICLRVGAQAVVALEAIETYSDIAEEASETTYTDEKGKEHITVTWTATRTTEVLSDWAIYDADNDAMVDETSLNTVASWSAEGETAVQARQGLPDMNETILDLAYEAGEEYARQIAPNWIRVSRTYYPTGNTRMANAKSAVLEGDLEAAAQIWKKVAGANDPKLAAKANYNLGIAWEGRGNLRQAISHVAAADRVLSNGRTSTYLALLKQRKAQKKTLKEQMAPVRGGDAPQSAPRQDAP